WRFIKNVKLRCESPEFFERYYSPALKPGTVVDAYGVAREPGSEAAKHMTYLRNPMSGFERLSEFEQYPYPDFFREDNLHVAEEIKSLKSRNIASVGDMQMTIWEQAWYMRGMMELMVDMMSDSECAKYHFDRILDIAMKKAVFFAECGADILFIGDDVGMQSTIMMSLELYREWIKPRLIKLVKAVKSVNPDIIIMYHSCGYIEPFIEDWIEVGIDVLNPLQPECMDFAEIYKRYGGRISFYGTIGTQKLMPFGTPEEVKAEVRRNRELAREKGGLLIAPTHMLEPEVPWANVEAYMEALNE
ncbi:MAG: uroporphyrinogen decarboxylase family protein, partial [Christensenellales bacterium]